MSKLTIETYVRGIYSPEADGEGTPSKTENFNVTLTTSGYIKRGTVYGIKQGQITLGRSDCLKGAENKGDVAEFGPYKDVDGELEEFVPNLMTAHQIRELLESSKKQVKIVISEIDFQTLKSAKYRLCFAKKLSGQQYNVVWQAYVEYLDTNYFSWTPVYQLFCTNTFKSGVEVKAMTKLRDIGLGEKSTLNKDGILSAPVTDGPKTSINLVNEYGEIHPGINQVSNGLAGQLISTPIYVSLDPIVKGVTSLTPVEKVLVWFEQNVSTSTMFSDSRSNSVEIDLTNENEAARLYEAGEWKTTTF